MTAIAILGPGGVGGFLAAALARAGEDVIVIAREETADVIERDGITVRSLRLGDFTARPAASSRLDERAEVLVVATKATSLDQALERVQAPPVLVVPLLNGLDHLNTLERRFGPGRVAAGAIRIESDRPRPGHILQTSPFLRVDLASHDPLLRPALQALAGRLEDAGVPARIEDSEAFVMWSKLTRLVALALTTSAYDQRLGDIRAAHRRELEACIAEAAAVANADGAGIDPGKPLRELDEAHATLGSSMQRDIAAAREPELDAIAGSVLRAAARRGIECPTLAALAARVAERAGVPAPV